MIREPDSRACASLISLKYPLLRYDKETKLDYIGPKIGTKIEEFLRTGTIESAQNLRASDEFQTKRKFVEIQGVGASTARELWEEGFRSVEQVHKAKRIKFDLEWHNDVQRPYVVCHLEGS